MRVVHLLDLLVGPGDVPLLLGLEIPLEDGLQVAFDAVKELLEADFCDLSFLSDVDVIGDLVVAVLLVEVEVAEDLASFQDVIRVALRGGVRDGLP